MGATMLKYSLKNAISCKNCSLNNFKEKCIHIFFLNGTYFPDMPCMYQLLVSYIYKVVFIQCCESSCSPDST